MRIISKTTAVTLSVLSGAVALVLAFSSASNALTTAESDYTAASSASSAQTVSSTTLSDSITQELASSRDAVTSAAGRVDGATSLDATTADAAAAEKALRTLNSALASRADALKSIKVDASLLPWDYTAATERLHAIDARAVDATSTARAALAKLAGSHASVVAAVADHTAVVARAAAEAQFAAETAAASKAAAAQTAAASKAVAAQKAAAAASQRAVQRSTQAASRAVASVPSFTSPPVSISVMDRALAAAAKQSSPYSVSVRTTFIPSYGADGVWNNGQSAVDAGGQNAIEYSNGWTDVAAHNGNDSVALQLKIGDIVNFSGAISGSYRVTGMIDIPQGSNVSIMGSLGAKMMMQTCDWNSLLMRVVGLVPA